MGPPAIEPTSNSDFDTEDKQRTMLVVQALARSFDKIMTTPAGKLQEVGLESCLHCLT